MLHQPKICFVGDVLSSFCWWHVLSSQKTPVFTGKKGGNISPTVANLQSHTTAVSLPSPLPELEPLEVGCKVYGKGRTRGRRARCPLTPVLHTLLASAQGLCPTHPLIIITLLVPSQSEGWECSKTMNLSSSVGCQAHCRVICRLPYKHSCSNQCISMEHFLFKQISIFWQNPVLSENSPPASFCIASLTLASKNTEQVNLSGIAHNRCIQQATLQPPLALLYFKMRSV